MKLASLRLDSFSAAHAAAGPDALTIATDEAYHRGHEQGLSDGREASLDTLTRALDAMRDHLAQSAQDTRQLRAQILAGVAPLLGMIVDLLGPVSQAGRLRLALTQELTRLTAQNATDTLSLRCHPDLRPEVEACLVAASCSNARIEDQLPQHAPVELIAGQGSIRFDPAQASAALKAIISDITAEE